MGDNAPTIVVIDDSVEVRSLIKTRISLSGLITVVADGADGTEAVGLAYRHQPSLLLLDLSMPTMDGLDALPGILAVSPNTRVVVYSGFEERGLAETARELGAAAFLEKSIPIDGLAGELLAVLRAQDIPPGHAPAPRRGLRLIAGEPAPADGARWSGDDQSVLDEHLERFREVFDEAAIGMATMTLTGTVVHANRALGALLRCKHGELAGFDYGRLTCGRSDLLDSAIRDITDGSAELAHFEHDLAGTAEPRKVLATLAPIRDSSGQALYVFLQVQDITAQRAAEDQLRRSEERFRLLVEAVQDYAIFMLDPGGHVVSWNTGAQRNKGYAAAEIIGQHFRIFYPQEKRAERHPEHELEIALSVGRHEEEGWRLRKDGTRFWANVVITAIFNEVGEHVGFAKVTRDMSERRAAEQDRDAARAALTEANVTLEAINARLRQAADDQAQFLAVTAHELRTPTAVLDGSADTLAKHWSELPTDERVSLLDAMTTSAGRLRRLVSDLLTVSRLDADSLSLHSEATPLSAIMIRAVENVRAVNPDADILVETVPDIEVMADSGRLAQAIENIIGNALQHGAPPVRVTVAAGTPMATIRVSDRGDGVDSAMRARLFDRFATGDDDAGTGLGLFIARELARAHGGEVAYESDSPDDPAGTFVLSVPLA